jgi:hypothetical protein
MAFVEILELAREMGLLKLGKVSTDGTHIKASASMAQNIGYTRAVDLKKQLQEDVEELLGKAEGADLIEEDEQSLPKQLAHRQKLIAKMDEAIEGLTCRAKAQQQSDRQAYEKKLAERERKSIERGVKISGREPLPPKKVEEIAKESKATYNLTDPDSRVMRKSKYAAYTQSLNAQASVDAEGSFLIVGNHLTQNSGDSNQLMPAYEAIADCLGKPTALLADAGYMNIDTFEQLERSGCEAYVSVSNENAHKERSYDYRPPDKLKPPKPISNPVLLAMRDKLSSEEGKAIYKLRCQTIETAFGIIKEVIGFRSFLLRGLKKMEGEWELVCLSYNCKRLHKLIQNG